MMHNINGIIWHEQNNLEIVYLMNNFGLTEKEAIRVMLYGIPQDTNNTSKEDKK